MRLFLLFAFVALVFSQNTVPTCNYCYAQNTNPCPTVSGTTSQVCKQNSNTSSTCKFVCINPNGTPDEINAAFAECRQPCQQTTYRCTNDQECKFVNNCYTCVTKCSNTDCNACANDVKGKDCAGRVFFSFPGSTGPVCINNVCGGCVAEWYLNNERICTRPGETCPTCNPCEGTRKVDTQTGCPICDSCIPTCKPYNCSNICPYGNRLDATGCKTCECNPCPPPCANGETPPTCDYGLAVDPTTNCKRCACAPKPCVALTTTNCNLTCTNGYVIDADGCKLCKCRECANVNCATSTTDGTFAACPDGYERYIDVNGCPTCKCVPKCLRYCPNGYDYFTGASNTAECKCKCTTMNCFAPCPNGYKRDEYGCQTCTCIDDYNNCTKVACDIYCPYGYEKDAKGCPTCSCVKPVCPEVACTIACLYGTIKDERGCPTCKCEPCPQVLCARYCEFGFAKNENGCPGCDCNKAPICPAGTSNTQTTLACPLDCVKGLTNVAGCIGCQCNEVEPCKCDPVPTDAPRLCLDKISYAKYTGECRRTADNKCYNVFIDCPIGIEVTIKGSLTDAQIAEIKAKNGITNSDDVSVTKVENTDGTNKYTFWVKKEGLPEGKNAEDVNKEVQSEAQKTDPSAVSYVLQENTNTPGNFGAFLVPLFGLLSFIFF